MKAKYSCGAFAILLSLFYKKIICLGIFQNNILGRSAADVAHISKLFTVCVITEGKEMVIKCAG
jgi:hypothetical protein